MTQQLLFPNIRCSRDHNKIQQVPTDVERVVCGKTLVDWEHAVVYVHDKKNPYTYPTHLHFSFVGFGPCLTTEVCALVDQWTFYRGHCQRTFRKDEHEYVRGRKMAIQVVETYRRDYMEKHGQPPNSLGLPGTLSPIIANLRTKQVNLRIRADMFTQQNLTLPEPLAPPG